MRSWLNAQRSKASNVGGDVYHLLSRCRGETSAGLPASLFFIPRERIEIVQQLPRGSKILGLRYCFETNHTEKKSKQIAQC